MSKTVSNPDASTYLIIVMGVSGCGKSTLAQALAEYYSYTLLDADDFHSAESKTLMANGIPLTDENRTPWVAAIREHLENNAINNKHSVLAFSGLKQKHRNELRKAGLRTIVLFLSGKQDIIQERINKRKGHFMAPHLLTSQFDSLENPESEIDVHTIDISTTMTEVIAAAKDIVNAVLLNK